MTPLTKKAIAFGLVLLGAWHFGATRPVARPPGVLAADAPVQEPLRGESARFARNGYQLNGLARFSLEARVLSVERYSFDRESKLSPVDLALGWGRMSDSTVLGRIDIAQGNRFYFWNALELPIPREEIEASSANMHMIPASQEVEQQLKRVRAGNVVLLKGYLVEAVGPDGWRWVSSLSRTDTGKGACELVWVESIEVR